MPQYIGTSSNPCIFKGVGEGGIDLTKDPKKGGMAKLRKDRRDCVRKGDAVSLGICSSWGVANVTTVTFNYILVIVFLFLLNVGVSLGFHLQF